MTFIEKIKLIERVDQLIRMKATGNPQALAQRLGIGRSTIYDLISCMETMGAEIAYCRTRRSFYYEQEVELSIGFVRKHQVTGGFFNKITKNIFPSKFFGQPHTIFDLENVF